MVQRLLLVKSHISFDLTFLNQIQMCVSHIWNSRCVSLDSVVDLQSVEGRGLGAGAVQGRGQRGGGGREALHGLIIRWGDRVHWETVVTVRLTVNLRPELSHCAEPLTEAGLKAVLQLFGDVQPLLQRTREKDQLPSCLNIFIYKYTHMINHTLSLSFNCS